MNHATTDDPTPTTTTDRLTVFTATMAVPVKVLAVVARNRPIAWLVMGTAIDITIVIY
jgi:hypothetical protein